MKMINVFLMAGAIIFCSCGSSNESDSVEKAKEINEAKDSSTSQVSDNSTTAKNAVTEKDANFAVEIANAGMTEIEAGKLAQQKAQDPRVKSFADMMVKDHTAAGDKLKQIAIANNITLPESLSNESQKELEELKKKQGKDFDKEYVNMMEKGHKKVVDRLKDGSQNCENNSLRNFATETLPIVQMHLDAVSNLQKSN